MLDFSDVGSTPTTSTIQQSGTVRTSTKAPEKSGAFSFAVSFLSYLAIGRITLMNGLNNGYLL